MSRSGGNPAKTKRVRFQNRSGNKPKGFSDPNPDRWLVSSTGREHQKQPIVIVRQMFAFLYRPLCFVFRMTNVPDNINEAE